MAAPAVYPVRVEASLEPPLSCWLWLVKWVLVIPHYVVLALLWFAFAVLSVVAFFAILFTGSYPRAIFEFNVGVLRWTWRVQYYTIGAFGTDRYPPFTLADDPSYPAHLEIEYPERLSRGLVLVKWWLLALPHYLVVGLFAGSGVWFGWQSGTGHLAGFPWTGGGLIGLLAVIAAVVLLVTGRYPKQIYDFVLGMNRWVLRVAAYAGLMTDQYPPFRLDMGEHEPGGTLTVTSPKIPETGGQVTPAGEPAGREPTGWTTARIVSAVAGALLILCSLGLLGGGGVALWAQTQRHGGYVDLGITTYRTAGYAIASDTVELHMAAAGWDAVRPIIGTVRISVTAADGATPVFAGIAPASAADRYLAGVAYDTVRGPADRQDSYLWHGGAAPGLRPAQAGIWTTQASGPGTQVLAWPVRSGAWVVAAMNADGSRPVAVRVNVAATLPALPWIATGLLVGGVVILAAGTILLLVPISRASRTAPPMAVTDS